LAMPWLGPFPKEFFIWPSVANCATSCIYYSSPVNKQQRFVLVLQSLYHPSHFLP
jgi:hypothetical protein